MPRKLYKFNCKTCTKEYTRHSGNLWGHKGFCSRGCVRKTDAMKQKAREITLALGLKPPRHNKGVKFKKGHKSTPEQLKKRLVTMRKNKSLQGEKNPQWKGGTTPIQQKIRTSHEYNEWRKSVFIRDGYKCTECGSVKRIEADHIVPFSFVVRECLLMKTNSGLFDISNGRTLCYECHKKTDTYGVKALKCKGSKLFDALYRVFMQETTKGTYVGLFQQYYDQKLEKYIQHTLNQLDK